VILVALSGWIGGSTNLDSRSRILQMNLHGRQRGEFGNENEAHRLKLYRAAYGSSRSQASTSWVPTKSSAGRKST